MFRFVLAVLGACATLGPVAALAQAAKVEEETAADVEDGSPRPIGDPREWVTFDDYPPGALREEASGRTGARLDLDAQGYPTRCTIMATSGSEVLDATACAKLLQRARFHPVLNDAGVAVAAVYETSVVWAASELPPNPNATTPQPIDTSLWVSLPHLEFDPAIEGDRTAMYDLEVDGTGAVKECTITRSSGDERFDRSLCDQLEVNAAFDVSSSGPGLFSSSETMLEAHWRPFPPVARLPSRSRNYAVRVFIEDDGSVSACRWIGRNAPALDPGPICHRSSWADQRNVNGELLRGFVTLHVSQRELDGLAIPRDDPNNPANRGITMVFLEEGGFSDCRWTGAHPPALDPLVACNYVYRALKQQPALSNMLRGQQSARLDESEVAALIAAQNGAREVD